MVLRETVMLYESKVKSAYRRKLQYGLISAAAVLSAAQGAWAAAFTWLAAPADNNWNTSSIDWNNGANVAWTNVTTGTLNTATFNAVSASQVITLATTINVGNITFTTGNWTLNSGALTTTQGAAGSAANRTLTLNSASGMSSTVNSTIQDGDASNVLILTKAGAGTIILGGTNTYTDATNINAGTLSISSASNLGVTAGVVAFGGGILQVTGTSLTTIDSLINAAGFNGGFDINNVSNIFTLGVNLGASGNGFTKTGAGTLKLTGSGKLTSGLLTVSNGTLDLNGLNQTVNGITGGSPTAGVILNNLASFTATLTTTGTSTFAGSIQNGAGTTALIISGGTLTLSATTNTYASAT